MANFGLLSVGRLVATHHERLPDYPGIYRVQVSRIYWSSSSPAYCLLLTWTFLRVTQSQHVGITLVSEAASWSACVLFKWKHLKRFLSTIFPFHYVYFPPRIWSFTLLCPRIAE